MDYMGCYSSVSKVVNQATEKFGAGFVYDELKNKRLQTACAAIDKMTDEEECRLSLVMVDDEKRITIFLECDFELVLQDGRNHPFFSLVKKFDAFSFSQPRTDVIQVALHLDGLWVEQS